MLCCVTSPPLLFSITGTNILHLYIVVPFVPALDWVWGRSPTPASSFLYNEHLLEVCCNSAVLYVCMYVCMYVVCWSMLQTQIVAAYGVVPTVRTASWCPCSSLWLDSASLAVSLPVSSVVSLSKSSIESVGTVVCITSCYCCACAPSPFPPPSRLILLFLKFVISGLSLFGRWACGHVGRCTWSVMVELVGGLWNDDGGVRGVVLWLFALGLPLEDFRLLRQLDLDLDLDWLRAVVWL